MACILSLNTDIKVPTGLTNSQVRSAPYMEDILEEGIRLNCTLLNVQFSHRFMFV